MKNILLLNPPAHGIVLRDKYCCSSSKANYFWPPIDLLVQSGILYGKHQVTVYDAIARHVRFEEAFDYAVSSQPDVVIFLTGSATWKSDMDFIKRLKENTGARTVAIGGNLLSLGLDMMRTHDFLDAILLDFTSSAILDFIRGDFTGPIRDMIIRHQGSILKLTTTDKVGSPDIVEYPVPRHELFPLKNYIFPLARKFPFANVITDFGCPYNCRFCVCEMLSYNKRSLKNITQELQYIKSLGIPELFINDFSFGVQKEHGLAVCEAMISNTFSFSWSCQARVDIDRELLKAMKSAGCHTIQFGVESGSQKILDMYAKGITKELISETFAFCRKIGIRTSGYFIFGLLGEKEEDLRATLDFALELDPDFAAFSIAMPREGTSLEKKAKETGIIDGSMIETDTTQGSLFETETLPARLALQYRNQALRSFYFRPQYIARRLHGIGSYYELKNNLQQAFALCKNAFKKPRDDSQS
ncbi:MAG TPA: radical SAM protein [Candidatus Omnitrophota bacterium]|nr:radical SAM protein [Candidatus Omnitrophota bacterium]